MTVTALIAISLLGARPDGVRYECVDLGAVLGTWARATALNNTGMVVGSSGTNDRAPTYWTEATGMQRLGPGSSSLRRGLAQDVNDAGMVVGDVDWYLNGKVRNDQAFSWRPGKGYRLLEKTPGSSRSYAYGVNASGWACGLVSGTGTACVWDPDGRVSLIGHLDPDFSSVARDMNDAVEACGSSGVGPLPGYSRAFRWSEEDGMTNLGVLPGYTSSDGQAINNQGTVVGSCWRSGLGLRGFRCVKGQAMEDLGGPGMTARDINESGQIVGTFVPAGNGLRAMLIEPGMPPIDLNLLTDGIPAGWILDTAYSINEHGDIAGMAAVGTNVRAFLLKRID